MATLPRTPFSASVQLSLEINGESRPVAESAPDRITLAAPADLPAGRAILKMVIDGRLHTRYVNLPTGASAVDNA